MMEILAFVAGVVVGFSVDSQTDDTFRVPNMAFQKLGTAVRKPVKDIDIRLRRREGWEDVRWRFDFVGERTVDFKALVGEDED